MTRSAPRLLAALVYTAPSRSHDRNLLRAGCAPWPCRCVPSYDWQRLWSAAACRRVRSRQTPDPRRIDLTQTWHSPACSSYRAYPDYFCEDIYSCEGSLLCPSHEGAGLPKDSRRGASPGEPCLAGEPGFRPGSFSILPATLPDALNLRLSLRPIQYCHPESSRDLCAPEARDLHFRTVYLPQPTILNVTSSILSIPPELKVLRGIGVVSGDTCRLYLFPDPIPQLVRRISTGGTQERATVGRQPLFCRHPCRVCLTD
jgi:hypothetical protein